MMMNDQNDHLSSSSPSRVCPSTAGQSTSPINTRSYEDQLKELFDSCDQSQKGYLFESELNELSEKLQLDEEQANFIIANVQSPDLDVSLSLMASN